MTENWEEYLESNYRNINQILRNPEYNSSLNMKTNSICKKIRKAHRNLPDKLIQAHVFTLMQIMIMEMSK